MCVFNIVIHVGTYREMQQMYREMEQQSSGVLESGSPVSIIIAKLCSRCMCIYSTRREKVSARVFEGGRGWGSLSQLV